MIDSNEPIELDEYEQKVAQLEQALVEFKRVTAANPDAVKQLLVEQAMLRQSSLTEVYPPPKLVALEDKRPTGVYETEGKAMFVHTVGGYEYSFDISYIAPEIRNWFTEVVIAIMNDIHMRTVMTAQTAAYVRRISGATP